MLSVPDTYPSMYSLWTSIKDHPYIVEGGKEIQLEEISMFPDAPAKTRVLSVDEIKLKAFDEVIGFLPQNIDEVRTYLYAMPLDPQFKHMTEKWYDFLNLLV